MGVARPAGCCRRAGARAAVPSWAAVRAAALRLCAQAQGAAGCGPASYGRSAAAARSLAAEQLIKCPSSGGVSRLAGELLWALCHKDRGLFVKRTGLGNAAGVLQKKGLIDLSSAMRATLDTLYRNA
jgi:hypothetical protein